MNEIRMGIKRRISDEIRSRTFTKLRLTNPFTFLISEIKRKPERRVIRLPFIKQYS